MTILTGLLVLGAIQAAAAPTPLQVTVPSVPGVSADPTCGGRSGLTTIATCLATTQANVETAVDALDADFGTQGWLAADGSENRVIYVKRRAEGGCDGFQLMAFAGQSATVAPAAPAYIALAAIPGDVCSAAPAAPATPATPPAS